jgi:hypothetical protein
MIVLLLENIAVIDNYREKKNISCRRDFFSQITRSLEHNRPTGVNLFISTNPLPSVGSQKVNLILKNQPPPLVEIFRKSTFFSKKKLHLSREMHFSFLFPPDPTPSVVQNPN